MVNINLAILVHVGMLSVICQKLMLMWYKTVFIIIKA